MFFKHMGYSKIAFWIQHLLHTLFSISFVRIALESCLIYVSSLKKKKINLFHPAFLTIWYTDMKKCTCNSPRHFSRFLAANKKPKLSFPYLFHFHKTHSSPQSSFKMWAFTHTYTPLQLILQWKVLKQFSLFALNASSFLHSKRKFEHINWAKSNTNDICMSALVTQNITSHT